MIKEGFYTALGTPLDKTGAVIIESLEKQIEDQVAAGAAGLFLFGTMGMGGCVKNSEYQKSIRAAAKAVRGRCALLVSASENSLARVAEQIEICNTEEMDGMVVTPPYYFKTGEASLVHFLEKAASMAQKDFYLYDHEPITKHKLTCDMLRKLAHVPNLKGIKSFDPVLIKQLANNPPKEDFTSVFSGSDLFDVMHAYGVRRYMDGVFACMPKSVSKVQKCFDGGDYTSAKNTLAEMMRTRDSMHSLGIWPSFSHAMNLLGYAGHFAPDYELALTNEAKKTVENLFMKLGELS